MPLEAKYSNGGIKLVPPPPYKVGLIGRSSRVYSSTLLMSESQYITIAFSGLQSSKIPLTSPRNSDNSFSPMEPEVSMQIATGPKDSPARVGTRRSKCRYCMSQGYHL